MVTVSAEVLPQDPDSNLTPREIAQLAHIAELNARTTIEQKAMIAAASAKETKTNWVEYPPRRP